MTYVLITGAAGNIGSALLDRLITLPQYHVVAVDNFLTGSKSKLPQAKHQNFTFIEADVNDREAITGIFKAHHFEFVFHYAAVVGVKRTLENPLLVLRDIEGIKNILELSKLAGVKRIFYSSSSEVYGEGLEFPQNESTTPLNSRLPYAVVKNVGESFLRSFNKEYGLGYTIFRFFNTYGPRQSEDFVVTRFLRQAMSNKPITVYGSGSQTRTFCYIDDNIETTLECLQKGLCLNDVMNVGNDDEIAVSELASQIIKVTGSKSSVEYLPALKEGDMTRRLPDISKMKSILKRPLTTLENGLKKTIEHWR
jgi:UDP-glucuronate decarboxylase